VLWFLWIAFGVCWFVALLAILFTGRYPRAIFEFNAGVLRWSWRVGFYSYGALGTDRYPPFTLAAVPGDPGRLDVDYPASLSRGLVLVKWWLLAIPQYVIVGLLGTLTGPLVFVAGVVLLFTGRYPPPIFDFLMGLQRWLHRVAAYAALMTDEYPPFRLDPGGFEPAGAGSASLMCAKTPRLEASLMKSGSRAWRRAITGQAASCTIRSMSSSAWPELCPSPTRATSGRSLSVTAATSSTSISRAMTSCPSAITIGAT
jgi:hypothetical protein